MRFVSTSSTSGIRNCLALGALGILLGLAGGCRNCEEKFCNGMRFVRDAGVSLANSCCRDPQGPGCRDLAERLVAMRAIVLAADEACHDGNLQVLESLWRDFKELVPAGLVLLLCDDHGDLERWSSEGCHPHVNAIAPGLVTDTIDLDIGLMEVTTGLRAVHHNGATPPTVVGPGGIPSPGSRSFVLSPGSTAVVESWFGDATLAVSGLVDLAPFESNEHGFRESFPVACSLDLHDVSGDLVGRIDLDPEGVKPIVLLDDLGKGRIGMPVIVSLHSAQEEVDWTSSDLVEGFWVEFPITIGKRNSRIDTGGPISLFDVCPVDPVQRAMLESDVDDVPVPDVLADPCDTMQSPSGTPWSHQALDWYWLITDSHPECFASEG